MDEVRRKGHHEEATSQGTAVQIVSVETLPNAPSRFILEKTPLRQILSKVGNRPIYLLSIAGASRLGKSFLMNVILHNLDELEKGAGRIGVDSWDRIASLHSLDGFHIEKRNVRDTIGFWMWSKPFVFKQSNGQEIAILLMDTQGVFDKFSTKREWAMIVGLSLLTSSCLIYNLQNNLLEDNLEIFTNFAEFGMLSLQGNENATTIFRKLLFLIKDWGFPNDNPYGSVGGRTFIHEQLKVVPEMPEELQKVRKTITTVFEEIDCFLMPHPGNAAKENDNNGSLRPLETVFLKNLKSFLEILIRTEELTPLHIGGNRVIGMDLMSYFNKYIELMNGQKIPKPASLHDVTAEANLDSILEDCVSFVRKAIEKSMTENDFIPLTEMEVIFERYFHDGIDRFKQQVVGQEWRQVSKYYGALTDNLTMLMNSCVKRNEEMKKAFILKLLDIAEVAYKKKVGDSFKNITHTEQDFEGILEKRKEEVVQEMDFGDRNEDFFSEVMHQVRAGFKVLDDSHRQTNSERLQNVESHYKRSFSDLLRDYDDLMEMVIPDDELDTITPMKLAKLHEKFEERIVALFLAGTKIDNENIQKKAVADLKAQTASRLANKSKKVQEIAQNSSSEAMKILKKALQRYHDGMAALLRNGFPTDTQIQEKHEMHRMMANSEFSSVVYVVKSYEESRRLKDLLERKIDEELEGLQSQVRKQREDFRSRWNGQVNDAGKKYSDLMNRILDSPKISSNSELKAEHEKLIEMIVHEAAQDSWLPSESKEQMQSEVRERLLEISGTFFSHHKDLLHEAEESAKNDICLFTKSHDLALKDRINSGKDSMTEEDFVIIQENLLGESKLQFEYKWSRRLPKKSLAKLMSQFLNLGDEVFFANMKTVQCLVRDKMKDIREIMQECSETYEVELDDKMDFLSNYGDLGVLEKCHKSAKMKAERELKKAMKEYVTFPKAEEMKSEFEEEVVKIFESKKVSLEKDLAILAQRMGDLGNSALELYHREMNNRKMDVSSEERLRAAHKEVVEAAIRHFERNVAGTMGNLTVAKLQDEKNKLEEMLAEELSIQLEDLNKLTVYRPADNSKTVKESEPLAYLEDKEELRQAMNSELDIGDFRAKQDEFDKEEEVASCPDWMDVEEETRSSNPEQSQIPAQVGIHFGFDFLSAVALLNGSPQTVYGPSPNTISFDSPSETFIGDNRSSSAKETLSFSEIFGNLDLNRKYHVYNGKCCQIEELVAVVLAHLHQVIGRLLHTNNVAYVIAFPSCFNKPARTAMDYAVQIAGLNAKIVRETCGLTAYFIKDFYKPVFANCCQNLVITIVENESDESSDVIGYEISNQVASPVFLFGSYPPSWSLRSRVSLRIDPKLGLYPLVEKIQKNSIYMSYNKSAIRVILHCSISNQERNMNIIKAGMPGVKVHFYPSSTINTNSNLTVGKGSALLAGYKFNPKFSQDWDRDHPKIPLRGFDKEINNANNMNCRMIHTGYEIGAHQVSELSQKVQSQVTAYHRSLEKEKSRGKTVYVEKSNQIHDSKMNQSSKIRTSRDLSALLKDMVDEQLSVNRIRNIINRMKNL
jgi:hypothetical protein